MKDTQEICEYVLQQRTEEAATLESLEFLEEISDIEAHQKARITGRIEALQGCLDFIKFVKL